MLLGKAKDNNASAGVGPFLRLLDYDFTLNNLRAMTITLDVAGIDGFALTDASLLSEISRDITDLITQTIGPRSEEGYAYTTATCSRARG